MMTNKRDIVKNPLAECIVVYGAAFNCGVHFSPHELIKNIYDENNLVLTHIASASWDKIYSS